MDSPASTVYLNDSEHMSSSPNSIYSTNNSPPQYFRPLTLLIQPLNSIPKSLHNVPIPQYMPSSSQQRSMISNDTLPHMQPMQGPNTNDYFGHGNRSNRDPYDGDSAAPDIETVIDPYDNGSGEQKFCGGYGDWTHVMSHTERSILQDLKSYPFPDDIKNQADVIYNKMRYQVRRGKIRFQMLFFCVYNAHIELGRDINPIQLGAQFGLTQGEVQRCDSLFSPLQTGYRPRPINTSPLGYLPDYCQNMDLSQEAIDEIMKMSVMILKKDPTLYQESPQTVAAGLLRYYTITNGITTDDPQKITRITNRSTVTIDGMFRRIATIDNS